MPKDDKKLKGAVTVKFEEVLESLMSQRIVIFLNTTTAESENHEIVGHLRGYSDKWIVIQELGDKPEEAAELTLVGVASIQILRKADPTDS